MADHPDATPSRAEQRAFERLPLQKNALLIARGMKQRACQMRDVCSGGALLELLDSAEEGRGFRRGEVILMRVLLGEGESARPHELRARIAHADGHLFGVSFFNPDPEAVANLLAAAGVAPAPAPVPALTPETQQLIEERLGQQLLNYCAQSLSPLFQASDEALLAAAEHAHSTSEQRLFFEAATLLRKRRDDLRTRYIKELKRSFTQPPASDDVSGLAHADREQFEAWLVVKVMAARVEEKCRLPLQDLQARLDALGHSGPDRQFRPFAPAALCVVFQQVIAELRFAPVIEKVLYRALEETLLANLCGLYEVLNGTLVQHNVLPRLEAAPAIRAPAAARPAPAATAVASTQPPRTAADFLARAGLDAPPAPARSVPALLALRELVALEQGREGVPAAAVDGLELRRVFAMLKAAHDGWRPALAKFVEHAGAGGVAGEVLGLLPFAEALREALAPDDGAARLWLGQVELALLHALVSDETFFSATPHPLCRLLEALARLGARETPLGSTQRAAIDALVQRIARDFDSEPGVIVAALPELEPLVTAQAQACLRNRDRVCLAAEGEQRLADARRHVQEVLDTRLLGRKVPQPVLTLLDAGWRDLLVSTLLRQGGRGGNWDAYLGLVDELLAIGADPRRGVDLRALLQLLKQGLAEGGELNPRRQQQAIAELKPLLAGAQRLGEDTVAWVVLPAPRDAVDKGERWLEKWLERTQRLQPGDWLELQHRGGAATERLTLAWRDEAGQRFVFVNRQGLKAGDFSRQELASLMHTGNALVCDAHPGLVEEALQQAGHRLYERLVHRVTHDPLTGLANRAEFMRQVERALEVSRRQRAHHVLARISLDQFAGIHASARAVADHLLRGVAQLLGKALAPRTLVARLGDGEFALLLEDCDLGKAQQLFSMRLGELAALRLTYEGESYKLTASAGLVEVGYTSESAASLLRAAGDASAEAQRHGGNRIEVYRPTEAEQARRDALVVWVAHLNDALEAERLALRCQRIQAAAAAAEAPPLGYEILLGLPPEEGVSPQPGEFVQAAERYHRMLAVDRWVIEHTFRWLRDHPERLAGLGLVSINLSAQSLADAQTPGFIFERLLKHKLPPGKFCFEISEAAAIAHLADAADFMQELKKAGCRFALDDFGAGHAVGEPLRRLPLDFVKIDGAFVRALGDDAEGGVLLRAINAMAHYAGVQTIAENVEDDATLARLRDIGVDFAQGYGIERPRPLE